MICPLCQKQIPDGSAFCGHCGKKVPRCPTCGTVIADQRKFCSKDGTPIPDEIVALFAAKAQAPKPQPQTPASQASKPQPQTPAPQAAKPQPQVPQAKAPKKTAGKGLVIFMVVLLMCIVIVGGVLAANWYFNSYLDEDDDDDDRKSSQVDRDEDENEGGRKDWMNGGSEAVEATKATEATEATQPEVTYEYRYEIIKGDLSWTEAKAACEAKGGYLATVTSREEFDTICKLADNTDLTYLWLGATLPTSSAEWKDAGWITGESWTFDNWYPGEPSKVDKDGTYEQYLCMWTVNDSGWSFNDQRNDLVTAFPSVSGDVGYVCEYKIEVTR